MARRKKKRWKCIQCGRAYTDYERGKCPECERAAAVDPSQLDTGEIIQNYRDFFNLHIGFGDSMAAFIAEQDRILTVAGFSSERIEQLKMYGYQNSYYRDSQHGSNRLLSIVDSQASLLRRQTEKAGDSDVGS